MAAGKYKLVYVVPERFRSPRFVDAARRCDLRLLAVDEAHCVSEWGHDFRPDYARLGRFRAQLGNPPTIALTATATDAVRRDIVELLSLRDPKIFITGFERPNLFYAVQHCSTDRDKDDALFRFLQQNPGSGIVYASTRKRCELVGQKIAEHTRRPITVYHAGMMPADRRAAQDKFMQGRTEIAVATLAFGMGIDKADVRFVVHYNLPGSVEAYYQEAGRAGRDGQPARCLLLAGVGDRRIHEFFIETAYPSPDVVQQVYEFLCGLEQNPIELTQQEVKEALGLQVGSEAVGACEKLLEGAGVLERLETAENSAAVRLNSDLPTLVDLLPPAANVRRGVLRAVERLVGDNRYQWFYLHPRAIAAELSELDAAALARHLRELGSLDAFDYVPPFRGRAIHLRDRTRAFDELAIDFEALERQKSAEYERLEHLVRFARDVGCRQRRILEYFGQRDVAACGHCDNCTRESHAPQQGEVAAPAAGPVLETVRKVLSGVARVRRGCGRQLLAQMLCGSTSQKVTRNRLDKLSTFGLLAHLKQQEVVALVEALLRARLVEEDEIEPFRPVLQLTARGVEVMRGQSDGELTLVLPVELWRKLDPSVAPPSVPLAEAPPPDLQLVDRLRRWRDETRRAENVPAFFVLSNALLDELARTRPRTMEELLKTKGMGPAKVQQYGQAILELLRAPTDESETRSPPAKAGETRTAPPPHFDAQSPIGHILQQDAAEGDTSRPSHYWTWRLLSAGFTPDECASIRGLSEDVVLDHALRAADSGHAIDAGWFLAPQVAAQIDRELGPGTPTRLRAILERLPRGTRYEDLQLVLKSRAASERNMTGS
jgi:ATP-dependent DNA helicase RecQ